MCEYPTWIEIPWNIIWLKAWLHEISHYSWGHVTIVHDFGSVLGWPLLTNFGLSQFHGHGSWILCEVALNQDIQCQLLNRIILVNRGNFSSNLNTSIKPHINSSFVQMLHTLLFSWKLIPILFTYPNLDIILYGSFYPSYSNSKICINLCSIKLKIPYNFSHVV